MAARNSLMEGKLWRDRRIVKEISVDDSGAIVFINYEHGKVHLGEFFVVGGTEAAIANNGTIDLYIVTPATKTLHTYLSLQAGGDATIQVYDSTTISAAGTILTARNLNREFPDGMDTQFQKDPTISALGTLFWENLLPGGRGGGSPGAISDQSEQIVFARNSTYLIRLTNIAGTAQPLGIQLAIYEVDLG